MQIKLTTEEGFESGQCKHIYHDDGDAKFYAIVFADHFSICLVQSGNEIEHNQGFRSMRQCYDDARFRLMELIFRDNLILNCSIETAHEDEDRMVWSISDRRYPAYKAIVTTTDYRIQDDDGRTVRVWRNVAPREENFQHARDRLALMLQACYMTGTDPGLCEPEPTRYHTRIDQANAPHRLPQAGNQPLHPYGDCKDWYLKAPICYLCKTEQLPVAEIYISVEGKTSRINYASRCITCLRREGYNDEADTLERIKNHIMGNAADYQAAYILKLKRELAALIAEDQRTDPEGETGQFDAIHDFIKEELQPNEDKLEALLKEEVGL